MLVLWIKSVCLQGSQTGNDWFVVIAIADAQAVQDQACTATQLSVNKIPFQLQREGF